MVCPVSGAETKLLAEPTAAMRAIVTRVAESISAMVIECSEHHLPMREFAMHIEIDTDRTPKHGVPASFVSTDDGGTVMVAPMPFAGFSAMPKKTREVPLLKHLLELSGKSSTDLVIACTDHKLGIGFVGYATRDFGLSQFVAEPPTDVLVDGRPAVAFAGSIVPKHVLDARAIAAEALAGLDSQTASAILHGGTASAKMTKARQIAGSDWPDVEDMISMLLAFGTPIDWDDLLVRLTREKTRHGFWWLGVHGEHPAGIAFIVQNPAPLDAIACLKGGMIAEKWTAATCPNATLGKRIVSESTTFVWYADEAFAAAEAAESTMRDQR
jgi:hypothetical protein